MNHHSIDTKQKSKVQRSGNRYKTSQKVDQHKIDEILGQELPETPPHAIPNNDFENKQSAKPAQYASLQGNSIVPGTNKSNKNQKLPVLPPLGQSKKQDHNIQKPSQQSHQSIPNVSNTHYINKRRDSDSNNHSAKNNNISRPTFELPKLNKKVDNFAISADLSDLENSESCSSAPEEFKKTLPKKFSKSNSIDNFNMTSTTIIEDFFQSSDENEYELDEDNDTKTDTKNKDDDFGDYSFDEIISDSDNEYDKTDNKAKTYHHLTSQELLICKDANSIHNEIKQRVDKLLKIARNHFPATKDNTAMLTRLVEQSRACHEFHFLEKRTKYYEGENRGLTIALTSLEDIISNPQSSGNNNVNINNKVKFGLQRLNALQMRQAKRMSKELAQAQRKIKKLRAEISKLHTEMRASIKTRRGGDGSLLIAEMSNNNNNNNGNNVANFGGGSGADDDELAALRVEHQFSIAKEKASVGVMQKENDELERIINTYEKRILLMTQKESNYSRLFKKKPGNSNEKSPPKAVANSSEKSPQKITVNQNEKSPQKAHSNVKSSLKTKPNQKNEAKKEISPNKKPTENKNQKSQKSDQKLKQQNQNEEQKPQQVKKESPAKKSSVPSSSNKVASPNNVKKEEEEEVPIIEVLSI